MGVPKDAASQTAAEYGEASSLHGIQYIFERGQSLFVSRLFWLLVVLSAIVVGVFWSVEVSVNQEGGGEQQGHDLIALWPQKALFLCLSSL